MRFAGSNVDFTPQSLASASSGGGYSSAADAVDVSDGFEAMRSKSPRYDQLSAYAMQTQSAEKQAAMEAEANVTANSIAALGDTKASQLNAQGAVKAAKEKAAAAKQSAMMGGFAKIASAGLGLLNPMK